MDSEQTRKAAAAGQTAVDPATWPRLKELVADALELAPAARDAFLARECQDAPALRNAALAMLAAAAAATEFLETPAIPAAVSLLPAGTRCGPYTIERLLGEGGFSEVYLAEQQVPIERKVALKLLKPGMDSRAILARFALERRTLARLEHPSIARILDAGATDGGRPFVAMEWVEGCTLKEFVREASPDRRTRLDLFLQACDAVVHAHQRGVIHRDLKPSNLLVAERDGAPQLKVIDFGIAKVLGDAAEDHTRTGQMLGTPGYWSPEQRAGDGDEIDVRADVYALGVVFRELTAEPAGSALPREFDWIVARACAPERERRYGSVGELAADVRAFLGGDALQAGPPTRRYRLGKFVRKHRGPLLAVSAVAATLIAGAVTAAVGFYRADQAMLLAQAAQLEADTTSDYLTRLITEVQPGRAGRDVKVRDLLDASGPLLQSAEQAPEAAARLHYVIGCAYQALGEYAKAKAHLQAAANSYLTRHGELDWRGIEATCQLAGTLSRAGELDALEELLPTVSARAVAARGRFHPKARVLIDLRAKVAFDRGRPGDAEQPLRELLELETADGSPDGMISTLGNLAQVLLSRRAIAEARPFATQGRELSLARHGAEHPMTLTAIRKLAAVEVAASDHAAVAALLGPVLPVAERVFGAEHPETLGIANYLAYAYQNQLRYAEADTIYRKLIPAQARKLARNNPQAAMTTLNYGRLLHLLRRYAAAEPVLRDGHARFLALRGPNDVNTTQADYLLCNSIAMQGRDAEVATQFATAVHAVARVHGPTSELAQSAHRDWCLHFARLLTTGLATGDLSAAARAHRAATR